MALVGTALEASDKMLHACELVYNMVARVLVCPFYLVEACEMAYEKGYGDVDLLQIALWSYCLLIVIIAAFCCCHCRRDVRKPQNENANPCIVIREDPRGGAIVAPAPSQDEEEAAAAAPAVEPAHGCVRAHVPMTWHGIAFAVASPESAVDQEDDEEEEEVDQQRHRRRLTTRTLRSQGISRRNLLHGRLRERSSPAGDEST